MVFFRELEARLLGTWWAVWKVAMRPARVKTSLGTAIFAICSRFVGALLQWRDGWRRADVEVCVCDCLHA